MLFTDASSSNEAVHLQQRLRSLSTELVTLRNRLHVQGGGGGAATTQPAPLKSSGTTPLAPPPTSTANSVGQPAVPPRGTQNGCPGTGAITTLPAQLVSTFNLVI